MIKILYHQRECSDNCEPLPYVSKDKMNEIQTIQSKIYEIRGQRVMLDRDLAELYQVTTGNLNKAVKRNIRRFPPDFMFQLTKDEFNILRSDLIFQKVWFLKQYLSLNHLENKSYNKSNIRKNHWDILGCKTKLKQFCFVQKTIKIFVSHTKYYYICAMN